MDYEVINLEEYVQTGEGGTALSYNHKDGKTLAKLFTPGMGAETAEREFLVNRNRSSWNLFLCALPSILADIRVQFTALLNS